MRNRHQPSPQSPTSTPPVGVPLSCPAIATTSETRTHAPSLPLLRRLIATSSSISTILITSLVLGWSAPEPSAATPSSSQQSSLSTVTTVKSPIFPAPTKRALALLPPENSPPQPDKQQPSTRNLEAPNITDGIPQALGLPEITSTSNNPPYAPFAGIAIGGITLTGILAALGLRQHNHFQRDRSLWQALLQTSPAPLIVLTPSGTITQCNPAAAELLGTSVDALLQQSIHHILQLSPQVPSQDPFPPFPWNLETLLAQSPLLTTITDSLQPTSGQLVSEQPGKKQQPALGSQPQENTQLVEDPHPLVEEFLQAEDSQPEDSRQQPQPIIEVNITAHHSPPHPAHYLLSLQLLPQLIDETEVGGSESLINDILTNPVTTVAEAASNGLWSWSLETGNIQYSPRWLEAIGATAADMGTAPRQFYQRIHPEDLAEVRTGLRLLLQGENSQFTCTYRLRHMDGHYRLMKGESRSIYCEDGELQRITGVQTDITDRNHLKGEVKRLQVHRKALVNCSFDPIVTLHPDGRIAEFNAAAERTFGFSRQQVLGMDLAFLFMAPSHQQIRRHMERYRQWQSGVVIGKHMQVKARRANGQKFLAETSISRIPVAGSVLFTIVTRDITKRLESAAALRESEERYALAVQGANDGIWDWGLKTNRVYFSPRWKSLLGYGDDEMGNNLQEWLDRVYPEDRDRLRQDLMAHLEGETSHFENEHRMLDRQGKYRWMLSRGLAVRNREGKAYRMAGSQTDITERKQSEERLWRAAYYDTLTQLPNRAYFMGELQRAMDRTAADPNYVFGVLFLDFDRFKVINDSLGHLMGDQMLCEIAQRLQQSVMAPNMVGRIGGDEFVILLHDLNTPAAATQVAECIFEKFREPFYLADREIFTGASIGIVSQTSDYERPEDILRDADLAMYRAKANGKGQYVVFDSAMRAKAIERLQSETNLRRAIERGEFTLFYQPILSLTNNNRLVGFEALVRWQHPSKGLVTPAEFIDLAEETGLIVELGEWVFQQACEQLTQWTKIFPHCKPLTMGINVSSQQLMRPEFVQFVQRTLQLNDLDPSSLKLEITESVIMESLDLALSRLDDLHALGTKVYIDDFGTGYSSFSYLQELPVDALKIDRTFVSQIGLNLSSWQIVQSIVTLAHALGLKVVAEGVETEEQLIGLRELDCEYAQGYLIGAPVDVRRATELLRLEEKFVSTNTHVINPQLHIPSQFPLVPFQ